MNADRNRLIVMLGTDMRSPGGITAVLRRYFDWGLDREWPIRFIATYRRSGTADKLLTASRALLSFTALLAAGRVSAVHAHTAARGSFWRKSVFLMLGRLAGARTILHLHDGTFPDWYWKRCGPLRRAAVRFVMHRMDRLVVLTPGWTEEIGRIAPLARFAVLPNPVSPAGRTRQPAAAEILFLGRLWREKGIDELLGAVGVLRDKHPDMRLVCAGDGDIAALRARAERHGLGGRVVFPGWVEGEAKEALMARATVLVAPSWFEGLPMNVLEALMNGIPVVATRVGGIPDAVGPDAGLLVPSRDTAALAAALDRVLSDGALRERMAAAGRTRALQMYETSRVMAQVGELYESLGLRRLCGRPVDAPSSCPGGS